MQEPAASWMELLLMTVLGISVIVAVLAIRETSGDRREPVTSVETSRGR